MPRIITAVVAALVWLGTFTLHLGFLEIYNDHFDRIARGRQIARYGELPFRDFLDPGYFLTEFASAAVQRIAGDSLLGEMLLSGVFMATGAVVVTLLALRVSQS